MPLTAAQLATLATDIGANQNTINGTAINALAHTQDNAFAVAAWYNQFPPSNLPTPGADFFGNYATVPVTVVRNCISWSKLTPADVPSSSNAATFLACQSAQWNLELMGLTAPNGTLDCTKKNVVQGLNDALKAVPSGVSGAAQDAGWAGATGVKQNICRKGTNAEKLFADTSGGAGSTGADTSHAATYTFEGLIQAADIRAIWGI